MDPTEGIDGKKIPIESELDIFEALGL